MIVILIVAGLVTLTLLCKAIVWTVATMLDRREVRQWQGRD